MSEFDLIARYFVRPDDRPPGVHLGIGDDCALLAPRSGHVLAISTDLLIAGRHFFDDVDPSALGWKTLAVNLSDLAAMGADPLAFTLALAMPTADEQWLEPFAAGLFACADRFGCALIGGDTTRGPLALCVTIFGEVPEGAALQRDGARVGDDVWVSGALGDASLALAHQHRRRARIGGDRIAEEIEGTLRDALERPFPRTTLGRALRGVATAAIDVSDGLVQDLGHVLARSSVGAVLRPDDVPVSVRLSREPRAVRLRCALAGGDDYELCFTAPADRHDAVLEAGRASATPVTRIGSIEAQAGLLMVDAAGAPFVLPEGLPLKGFDHFAAAGD